MDTVDKVLSEEPAQGGGPQGTAAQGAQNFGTAVALIVALLSTLLGIFKVKDDNIVQAMQQAQADKIDHWNWYQARHLREDLARSTAAQLRLQVLDKSPALRHQYEIEIRANEKIASEQEAKRKELQSQAENDQNNYDALNYKDDQFDLSDAFVAIAISMLAISVVTHRKWLLYLALVPAAAGVAFGVAGLLGLKLHPDFLTRLLS